MTEEKVNNPPSSGDTGAGGSGGGVPSFGHTDSISYRIPRLSGFYRSEPSIWFSQAEIMFDYARLTSQKARAGAVISVLDFEVVMSISDLIQANPARVQLYDDIKQRLISNFSVSPEARLRQLLKGEVPAEGKPSLILSRIKNLSQGKCSQEIIKAVFLDQLPSSCRATLTLSEITDLEKIAEMADRFMEASCMGESCAFVSSPANNNFEELIGKIDALSARFESFEAANKTNNQGLFNKKNRFKTPNKDKQKSSGSSTGLCFYHKKFGNSAYKCVKPCNFQGPDKQGN
ncbi:uncharacterized protein LOC122506112 [Leptopilina heterotoma]|uniref:uncharacterized protein LOC122506112 n=1 Tax=Leptopilina heterotoma TaxID=63436 RepID=UPI001CA9DE02|nr:uncharacterized protein LOC122506112 [Leptopilina heterotoma]